MLCFRLEGGDPGQWAAGLHDGTSWHDTMSVSNFMICMFPVFPASQKLSPEAHGLASGSNGCRLSTIRRRDIKNFLVLLWSKGLALVIPQSIQQSFKPRAVQDHLHEESQKNKGEGWVWNQTPQESKSRKSCSFRLTVPGSSKMQNVVHRKDYICSVQVIADTNSFHRHGGNKR